MECFRGHKEECARSAEAAELPRPAPQPAAPAGEEEEEEEGDRYVVTDEQYGRLRADEALRAALRDERLQAVLVAIDSAPDRRAELRKRLDSDSWFARFADDALIAAGVCRRGADGRPVVV